MQRYASYPDYKPSRVDWLVEVPAHWAVKRLKNVASYNDDALDEKTDPDYEIEYVDISSVSLLNGVEQPEKCLFENAPSRARRRVKDGDVIVSTVRTYLKAIAAINHPADNMIVSTGFAVIRPLSSFYSGYAGYLLQSNGFVGDVVALSVGVSYPAINASDLVRIPVVEPPFAEQQTITRFLDHKTAQINALIAKKQALLDKLAEKRSALISHAVTKGLNSSVPMKDSGVAWLGEIPAHWKIKQLRHLLTSIEQGWSPQCHNQPAQDGEWGVLKVGCVNGRRFDESENKLLPEGIPPIERYEVKDGDILVSRANTRELLGSAAIATNPRKKLLLCDKLYRLNYGSNVCGSYLVKVLRSTQARCHYERYATGASGSMQNIGQDTIKSLVIAFPPLNEQVAIDRWIEDRAKESLLVEASVREVIDRLQEYRAALITNAVTGKIDVRSVKLPEAAEEPTHA